MKKILVLLFLIPILSGCSLFKNNNVLKIDNSTEVVEVDQSSINPKTEEVNKQKIKIPYSTLEDFEKFPSFEDYPITEIFKGEPASVDLTSHPKANMYRTALRLGSKEGPNFAGHYTVITIGCGSPCQIIAVVDVKTGYVYFLPFPTAIGAEYRLDSNLIIFNPPSVRLEYIKDSRDGTLEGWENFPSYYYKWENNQFIYLDSNESDDSFNYKFR